MDVSEFTIGCSLGAGAVLALFNPGPESSACGTKVLLGDIPDLSRVTPVKVVNSSFESLAATSFYIFPTIEPLRVKRKQKRLTALPM